MTTLRIALFGGSFDPVHLGHIAVCEAAVQALGLDKVILIPCRQSPHKHERTHASEDERLEMLQLASAGLPWAEISEIEDDASPSVLLLDDGGEHA